MPPPSMIAIPNYALQALNNAVARASKKEHIQDAIDQYHVTVASRFPGFGQNQSPFTLATLPEYIGTILGPSAAAAQDQVNKKLKLLEDGGQSDTPSALEMKVRGRKSTILTGSRGDLSTAPASAPTLLGDVGHGKSKPGS